jgi:hypothetical protein
MGAPVTPIYAVGGVQWFNIAKTSGSSAPLNAFSVPSLKITSTLWASTPGVFQDLAFFR